ncbi:3-hydroxyacyl-CoA dehydrogenase NAD-binding domain-containing protein [Candidatus Solincola tengchongensis]|uniref:3-hydroxyacyl-CoA dehydrogenase NAD-binding domain-containing protein n=1 Tax=Candidatus Solincola tengchongensis TaxID=2900693 RepID=UPI00257BAEAB|nr:3-hydroxyacyl-CoA dehydrogenase NAD-binding domain-containing protein [Candidatus Solincola tengchongensis]
MPEELVTHFKETYYDSPAGKVAIVTMDNGEDYRKPNTFGFGAMQSLNECLDRIQAQGDVKAMVLTGKPFIFAAGADLTQVPQVKTKEQAMEIARAGHAAFKRIIDLPFVTVAAVNGVALGGGLEIALACKYRTVASSVEHIGFPECFLGLIPGWGGTTLLPKLVGPEKAIQVIIYNALNNNRMIKAKEALDMGIMDRMFEPVDLLDKSVQFAVDLVLGKEKVERPEPDWSNLDSLVEQAKAFADSKVHGNSRAPYMAIDIIAKARDITIDEGFALEDEALGELIPSPQMQAGAYAFDLTQRRARKPVGVPEGQPLPVRKVGILGAGLMGSQLAVLFLRRMQIPVVIKDIKQEFVDRGVNYIQQEINRQAEKGRIDKERVPWLLSLVEPTLDYKDMAECDFIIEAVLEEMPIKKQVFGEIEEHIAETAILATNTSSLSVTEMASDLKHPERVVGFHFFNPVAAMPLLEIIKAEKTNDPTLITAFDVGKKLGKRCVLCKDAPAFVVNRLLIRSMVETIKLVDEGNDFKDVDQALWALGTPMPPFALLALVGPAIAMHATETLAAAFPERYFVSDNLRELVARKKPGVYGPDGEVDPEVREFWKQADPPKKATPEEMRDRVSLALADEAWHMLEDGVVGAPQEIDICMIFGAGYPFYMGGLTKYLDYAGYSEKARGKKFHPED